jgi:putative ABC transport system ATP-binding protein
MRRDEGSGSAHFIELRNVCKSFREGESERVVFCGVTAAFRQGETSLLYGKSGSGKSTLLNLLSGIDLPTSGEVLVNGTDITGLSEEKRTLFRRRHVGFVFQFFNLLPTLTVAENVLLSLELDGRTGADARARALDFLGQVGLADRAASRPDRLSGGEQQRVAIARALAHDPALILADEPTGNLDSETGRHIVSLLTGLSRREGKTLVMATHSGEALAEADRVFTMKDGLLHESGRDAP